MLVRDRMTTDVLTVTPETSLEETLHLMQRRHIRRLPVLQHGRVVGIVTWTDLMRAQPSPATTLSRWEIPALLEKAPVRDVMTRSVKTVTPDAPLEEAAIIMRHLKIGALPIIQNGALVGIVTESDIFDAFISLVGARHPSYRITLDVDDSAASLPDIAAAFRLLGLRVYSVSTYEGDKGRLRVVVRVERAVPLMRLVETLRERGLEAVHGADGSNVLLEITRAS